MRGNLSKPTQECLGLGDSSEVLSFTGGLEAWRGWFGKTGKLGLIGTGVTKKHGEPNVIDAPTSDKQGSSVAKNPKQKE